MMPALDDQHKFKGLPGNIPALQELISRRQWVAWRYAERDGEMTKPPINPHNGYGASHSDPATWGTYEQAVKWAVDHDLPGVGYVISEDDDYTGVDLDDCREIGFGSLQDWADKIIAYGETYAEVSPSGEGVRLIWRGKIDKTIKCDPMSVEVYREKRYLTITGNHIPGTPKTICPAPKTEAALRARVESYRPSPPVAGSIPANPPPKKGGAIATALLKNSGRGTFFKTANSLALQKLSQWVPELFGPMAEFQDGTRAWRVSSKSLGRNLQEDLSIAPNGIVDFGVHDMGDPALGKRTAIDLVLEFGTQSTAVDAAQWLCQRMGVAPTSIGWTDPTQPSNPFLGAQEPAQAIPAKDAAASVVPPARFIFEKIGDLRLLPPVQWLVKDWIPDGALGIFYGKWAAGKSFIGFDLGLHLAYGMTDWHGAALPGQPCHVLVIAREGHQGFVNRVDAFKSFHGLPDDDSHITFMRGSVSFMRDDDFVALCDAIRTDQTNYQLIIVDTVARVVAGVDINKPEVATLFMERIAILGQITGAATIGVHHENKAGGMMGSVFFEANSDFVFEVIRNGEDVGPLTSGEIVCTKMKDGEDRWKRTVAYEKIALSILPDGPSSLVVKSIAAPSQQAKSGWPDKDVCRRVLAFIHEEWCSGSPLSMARNLRGLGRSARSVIARKFEIEAGLAERMLTTWLEVRPAVLAVELVDKKSHKTGLKVVGSIDGIQAD